MNSEIIKGIKVLGTVEDEQKHLGFFRMVAANAGSIAKTISVMQETGIINLAFNTEWGWKKESKIDFIVQYPWIEGIAIIDNGISIEPLNKLPNLKRIQLADKVKGCIDFAGFEFLEVCALKWSDKQFINLENCRTLKYLNISAFNKADLAFFKGLQSLKELKILYNKIMNLNGIEQMPLTSLSLWSLSKLQDISTIENLKKTIKKLHIYKCANINSYNPISVLDLLEEIQIIDSAPVQFGNMFNNLKCLKNGYIGVEVLDNKIDVLRERGVNYKKYKSYAT